MKKIYLLALLLLGTQLRAQITVESNDFASLGDSVLVSRSSAVNQINYTSNVPGQVWDFRVLEGFVQSQQQLNFVSPLRTPYPVNLLLNPGLTPAFLTTIGAEANDLSLSLPIGGNVVLFDRVYDFFVKTQTLYENRFRGLSAQNFPILFNYTNPDEVYNFPINLGDSTVSTFAYEFTIPASVAALLGLPLPVDITVRANGTRTNVVDGYGTVRLPLGDFEVLRMRTRIVTNFILLGLPVSIPFSQTENELKFIAKDRLVPVVTLRGPGAGEAVAYTSVEFQDFDRLPEPAFTVESETRGCRPLTVAFVDRSFRADNVLWDFGDGNLSTQRNPVHTYRTSGRFTVRLTAFNSIGEAQVVRTNLIDVTKFDVDFDALSTSVNDPSGRVRMINRTPETGAGYSYIWDFGDGFFSTEREPVHYYNQPGVYGIRLVGINPAGCRDTLDKVNYMRINMPTSQAEVSLAPELQITLSPNPVKDVMGLRVELPAGGNATLEVMDVQGRVVLHRKLGYLSMGDNMLSITNFNLAQGIYQLRLQAGNHTGTLRFLVIE